MYRTSDGEELFVVDGHTHFWDAAPANQRNIHGKQFIDCFYAYHSALSPEQEVWPKEKFEKYDAETMVRDLFVDGPVDMAIIQPTYLKEFYIEGFNTTEQNAVITQAHPDRFILNGSFDPREGTAALEHIHALKEAYGIRGVKLYTAEWRGASRGWRLNDTEAYRCFELCEKLGITNMHVHKGPTITPLAKDAFDCHDVDYAATDFPNLKFIVEHVGLPRLDDFCWIAVQEENVWGGARGGDAVHARPPALLRRGNRRTPLLGRRGQADLRERLRDLDAEVAGGEVLGLRTARGHQAGARRRPHARGEAEDPRA